MASHDPALRRPPLGRLQAGLAILVLGCVALIPPAQGPMLLLPLRAAAADHLAARAIDAGARLLAPGPVGGSLLVDGSRARLAGLAGAGVLVINAPAAWCGRPPSRGRMA